VCRVFGQDVDDEVGRRLLRALHDQIEARKEFNKKLIESYNREVLRA
jgi:hypothetical protein